MPKNAQLGLENRFLLTEVWMVDKAGLVCRSAINDIFFLHPFLLDNFLNAYLLGSMNYYNAH